MKHPQKFDEKFQRKRDVWPIVCHQMAANKTPVELEKGSIPMETGQVGQFRQVVAAPGLTEHGSERGITANIQTEEEAGLP